MRFREGGVGHTSSRAATDQFLQDRDRLDRDSGLSHGRNNSGESKDGSDIDDVDEAGMDKEGDNDNHAEGEHIQGSQGDNLGGDGDDDGLRGGNGSDDGQGLRGSDEEREMGDEGRSGDEEEDYGYKYLVDEDDEEDDDEPLDDTDDALGPEDGEGDVEEVNLLGFAAF